MACKGSAVRSRLAPGHVLSPSSRGLGHRPFTAVTGVRIPLGMLVLCCGYESNRNFFWETIMSTILVTGASGFIALHVVQKLLEAGHNVHATVRSSHKKALVEKLFLEKYSSLLTIYMCDLLSDDGWLEAMRDCDYVIHCASPFPPKPVDDPQILIRPAKEGTLRVLRFAQECKVKHVVVTSSIAAVAFGRSDKKHFGPVDWSDIQSDTIDDYQKSKTLAEQAAWQYVQSLGTSCHFTLCTILPGLVIGPMMGDQINTSNRIIERMMRGDYPGYPHINIAVVDVREVAEMHILAMNTPDTSGKRLIMAAKNYWIKDVASILRKHGYKNAPSMAIPNFVINFLALFDNEMALASRYLGMEKYYDCSETTSLLNWEPLDYESSIVESAKSIDSLRDIT